MTTTSENESWKQDINTLKRVVGDKFWYKPRDYVLKLNLA